MRTQTVLLATMLLTALCPNPAFAGTIDKEIELHDGLNMVLKLYHGYRTTLHFPVPPIQLDYGNSDQYDVQGSLDRLRAMIDVDPMSSTTNLNVTWPGVRVTFRLEVVNSPKQAKGMYRFRMPEMHSQKTETSKPDSQDSETDWISDVVRVQTPLPLRWNGPGHTLELRPGIIQHTREATLLPFAVENVGDYPFPVTRLEIKDRRKRNVRAELVRHSWMGTTGERQIAQGETATFMFRVTPPAAVEKGWIVRLVSSSAIPTATFAWTDKQHLPARTRSDDRFALVMRALGGAAKLDNGEGLGVDQRAWAPLQGIGAQLSISSGARTKLEANADLLRTSAVHIDDTTVRTSGGRLHVGGRVHTGNRLQPYARGGVGILLTHNAIKSAERTVTDFRASGLLVLGTGVDWFVGSRTIVGLSMLGVLPIGGDLAGPALELGLHIGLLVDR